MYGPPRAQHENAHPLEGRELAFRRHAVSAATADLGLSLTPTSGLLLTSRITYTEYATNGGPATSPGCAIATQLPLPLVAIAGATRCVRRPPHRHLPMPSLAFGASADESVTGAGPTDPNPANNNSAAITPILIGC
jgi:hypothetical protein